MINTQPPAMTTPIHTPGMKAVCARYALIAACMMHVEGFYSTKSAAYRHKNPGNIMHVVQGSGGAVMQENDYPSIQVGFNALLDDIMANRGKTLKSFVFKYAPPSENDTNMYLQVVSVLTEIRPDDLI